MTRDEIKKLFPEATEEQVSALLNSHHADIDKLRETNKSLKEKADKFDEAEREKLSKEEKLNKLIEEANKAKSESQRLLNRTKAAAKLSATGLTEEEYSAVLDGFVSDNEEQTIGFAEALTKLIGASREKAAAAAKQELLQTPAPVTGTTPPAAPDLTEQFSAAAKANDMLSMIKAADSLTAVRETQV